jgi:hypothetical protein
MSARDFSTDPRVFRMYVLDWVIIVGFLTLTWGALLFVLRQALPLASDPAVKQFLQIAATSAGIASTAALVTVLIHLKKHRRTLYAEELSHLSPARKKEEP